MTTMPFTPTTTVIRLMAQTAVYLVNVLCALMCILLLLDQV